MKPTRKRTTGTPDASPESRADGRTVILVRRGALRRFDHLTRKTAELPVLVTWDRRLGDRRTAAETPEAPERRRTDRRQKPPFTWDLADFVVVPSAALPATAPARRRAAAKSSKPSAARPAGKPAARKRATTRQRNKR